MRPVRIVSIGDVDPALLDAVCRAVRRELLTDCFRDARALSPDFAFHPERRQYHSTAMLERLASLHDDGAIVAGITGVDLFIPILTYVFGEAQLGGRAALASHYRMAQQFYGLPEDLDLMGRRLVKTALHEIGHTAGLTHCDNGACVMAAAYSVEWIDLKERSFCATCRDAMR